MGDKTAVDGDLGGIKGGEQGRENECGSYFSMLYKANGSGPESGERTRNCNFHITLATAGEALVFHFSSVAKQ